VSVGVDAEAAHICTSGDGGGGNVLVEEVRERAGVGQAGVRSMQVGDANAANHMTEKWSRSSDAIFCHAISTVRCRVLFASHFSSQSLWFA